MRSKKTKQKIIKLSPLEKKAEKHSKQPISPHITELNKADIG